MRLINASHDSARVLIILTAVIWVASFMLTQAQASMVIAPSTIVSNSAADNSRGNFRAGRDKVDDNTVKAIIGYPLDAGCRVIDDPSGTLVYFSVLDDPVAVQASSIRYCYVDQNLIVEFDRKQITDYLETYLGALKISGDSLRLVVVVDGTFRVSCADDPFEIDHESAEIEILLTGKQLRK